MICLAQYDDLIPSLAKEEAVATTRTSEPYLLGAMKAPQLNATLSSAVRLHQAGRFADAEAAYRRVLKASPKQPDALRLLGMLLTRTGNPADGLRLLRKAAKLGKRNPNTHLDLAQVLAARGDAAGAIAGYRKVIGLIPDHAGAWRGLAIAQLAAGRPGAAADGFRKAIALDPDGADLHVGLGNALRSSGDLAAAQEAFRQAIAMRPDFAEVHMNLGNLASELGDLEDAIASLGRAVRLKPNLIQAHQNLAVVLKDAGRLEEAADAYRAAHAVRPEDFETLFGLGVVTKKMDDLEASLDWLRRAHALRPGHSSCALAMMVVLRALGRPDDELAAVADGLADGGGRADAHAALADGYESLNSLDKARQAAARALAIDADHVMANTVMGRIERRGGDARAARDRLRGLEMRGGRLDSEGYTALGHACDRLADYGAAYEAFADAQRCAEQEYGGDVAHLGDEYIAHIRGYRSWYDAERSANWKAPADDGRDPVFFVGFPRSGTTLLEQMLDSHPNLATTGEALVLGQLPLVLPSLLGRGGDFPRLLDGLRADEIATLRRWYLERTSRGAKRAVDKLPLNVVELGLIRRLFPRAPVIVALRDPRDVVLSCFMQNFKINWAMGHCLTVEGTAKLYAAVMDLWLHYRADPGFGYLEYRYEDLVADAEGVARRVIAYIGEPWDKAVLQYAKRAGERFVRTPSYADVSQPLYDRSIGRWRNYARHLAPALPVVARFVAEFGYDAD